MRKIMISLVVCFIVAPVFALVETFFSSYDLLKNQSPDILVVRGIDVPPPASHTIFSDDNAFRVEIIAALKGSCHSGAMVLNSDYWLHKGDLYLVFCQCNSNVITAYEDYRVVPLGQERWHNGITNVLAGKSLDEQLQTLFNMSVEQLNLRIKAEQEEKSRVEGYLKN